MTHLLAVPGAVYPRLMIEIVCSCFIMERVFLGTTEIPSWVPCAERGVDGEHTEVKMNVIMSGFLCVPRFVCSTIRGQAFCGEGWRTGN